jgi:hypothetical protein
VQLSESTAEIISPAQLGVNGGDNEGGHAAAEGKLVLPEQSTGQDV